MGAISRVNGLITHIFTSGRGEKSTTAPTLVCKDQEFCNPDLIEAGYWIGLKAGWWFGCHVLFSHILGMSSSQLTFIFFRGVAQPPTRRKLEVHPHRTHGKGTMNSCNFSQPVSPLSVSPCFTRGLAMKALVKGGEWQTALKIFKEAMALLRLEVGWWMKSGKSHEHPKKKGW